MRSVLEVVNGKYEVLCKWNCIDIEPFYKQCLLQKKKKKRQMELWGMRVIIAITVKAKKPKIEKIELCVNTKKK